MKIQNQNKKQERTLTQNSGQYDDASSISSESSGYDSLDDDASSISSESGNDNVNTASSKYYNTKNTNDDNKTPPKNLSDVEREYRKQANTNLSEALKQATKQNVASAKSSIRSTKKGIGNKINSAGAFAKKIINTSGQSSINISKLTKKATKATVATLLTPVVTSAVTIDKAYNSMFVKGRDKEMQVIYKIATKYTDDYGDIKWKLKEGIKIENLSTVDIDILKRLRKFETLRSTVEKSPFQKIIEELNKHSSPEKEDGTFNTKRYFAHPIDSVKEWVRGIDKEAISSKIDKSIENLQNDYLDINKKFDDNINKYNTIKGINNEAQEDRLNILRNTRNIKNEFKSNLLYALAEVNNTISPLKTSNINITEKFKSNEDGSYIMNKTLSDQSIKYNEYKSLLTETQRERLDTLINNYNGIQSFYKEMKEVHNDIEKVGKLANMINKLIEEKNTTSMSDFDKRKTVATVSLLMKKIDKINEKNQESRDVTNTSTHELKNLSDDFIDTLQDAREFLSKYGAKKNPCNNVYENKEENKAPVKQPSTRFDSVIDELKNSESFKQKNADRVQNKTVILEKNTDAIPLPYGKEWPSESVKQNKADIPKKKTPLGFVDKLEKKTLKKVFDIKSTAQSTFVGKLKKERTENKDVPHK